MRLIVFNCLLLASVAVALPNGRDKRHLIYLKNLINSAISGGSQITVKPPPILQEENGYKLFKLPGFEDIMVKVAPKKQAVEEFVYPAAQPVNLNAFGKVIGTKSKDDTLVAVKGVDNLLSTGILYENYNTIMKKNLAPMFPSLNTANYVVKEKIKAPVIEPRRAFAEVSETRPVLTEVRETRPFFTEIREKRPVFTNVIEPRPAFTEIIEPRPAFTEVIEPKPVFTEIIEPRPTFTEVIEPRPVFTEVIEPRPTFTEIIEPRQVFTEVIAPWPACTEVIESRPVFPEIIEPRPDFTELIEPRPIFTEIIEPSSVFTEVIEPRPTLTEIIEPRPVFTEITGPGQSLTEIIEPKPVFTEVIEPRPSLTEIVEPRPVFTEVIEPRPIFTEVIEPRPSFTEVIEPRPTFTEVIEPRPVFAELIEPRPTFTDVIEPRPSFTEVIKPPPVLTEVIEPRPVLTEVIENSPVLSEVIRPIEEKVELKVPFESNYLYQQIQNNEPVMTFTGHTIPGVELIETIKTKTDLPMYVKNRVDEAFILGADPKRLSPVQKVFQYENPPVVDLSYPLVEPYVQNGFREEVLTGRFGPVADRLSPQRLTKDKPARYHLRATKTQAINPHPIPLHSNNPLHSEEHISASKDKASPQTKKVPTFTYSGDKVDISQTLGPIPPQYISHVSNKGENAAATNKKTQQVNDVPIVSSKDRISNGKIPNEVYKLQSNPNTGKVDKGNNDKVDISKTLGPIPSQYISHVSNKGDNAATNKKTIQQVNAVPIVSSKDSVFNAKIPDNVYKLQSNPNTGKVVKEDGLRTNVKTSPTHYVIASTVDRRTPEKDAVEKKVVYTNTVVAKPQSGATPAPAIGTDAAKLNILRENVQPSFKNNPIVLEAVKDYTYHQKNADGSSVNVKGDKHGVSVDVKQNKPAVRGDIPG